MKKTVVTSGKSRKGESHKLPPMKPTEKKMKFMTDKQRMDLARGTAHFEATKDITI